MGWFSGDASEKRLARIEAKLNAIMQHLEIPFVDPSQPSSLSNETIALIRSGQKLPAIKLHREQTGCSLRDAKEAVDGYGLR